MSLPTTNTNLNCIKKPYGIVYIIANTTNEKVYIGKTRLFLSEIWNKHLSLARRVKYLREQHPHRIYYVPRFINALIYHNEKVWKKKVLDIADTDEELEELCLDYIKKFRATNPEKGYNRSLRRCY